MLELFSHFTRRIETLFLIALLIGICSCNSTPDRLNVLLITVDTLRADHLGCFGYSRNTSPAIDSLAASGTLFTKAFSQTNITLPSHLSILTSSYMLDHGVYNNTIANRSGIPGLDIHFSEAGYRCAAVVSGAPLNLEHGQATAYDDYFDLNSVQPQGGAFRNSSRLAEQASTLAIDWIERYRKKPFFLWVHYFDPHMPYLPPEPFRSRFVKDLPERLDLTTKLLERKLSLQDILDLHEWTEKEEAYFMAINAKHVPVREINDLSLTPDEARSFVGLYDGEIAYTDSHIARLLEQLERFGIRDQTLVVLTADHGEALGDHDIYCTHRSLFNPILQVPLVFSLPGKIEGGVSIETSVQTIDIAPTILEMVELPLPDYYRGISLVPFFEGKEHPEMEDRTLRFVHANISAAGIIKGKWKWVSAHDNKLDIDQPFEFRHEAEELYNLLDDPMETANLVASGSHSVSDSLINDMRLTHAAWFDTTRVAAILRESSTVDETLLESLRALGYVQ